MKSTLSLFAMCCAGLLSAGCAPALPRAEPALELSGLAARSKPLDASYRATDTSCRAEEQRLARGMAERDTHRKVAEVAMAVVAGGLAVGTAVYAALDPSPKATVVVPLSAGAAAGAVPLTVLLASDAGTGPVEERVQRIRDRRLDVRDAHQRLMGATRERERAEAALGELMRRLSEKRLGEAGRHIEASSALVGKATAHVQVAREEVAGAEKAPREAVKLLDEARSRLDEARAADRAAGAALDAGREAVLDAQRAAVEQARQREIDAEGALAQALLRLGEVCGKGAAR